MTNQQISEIISNQRKFFYTGRTLKLSFRIAMLKRLKYTIKKYETQIAAALMVDLGKSKFESYMCEIGMALDSISHMLKNISSYAKDVPVKTPLAQFPARSFKRPSPYGVALIMSPWNYPFLLTIDPLVAAIAAGNTAVVKPSAYSSATSQILNMIINECFDKRYVAMVTGGRLENTALLNSHFDYIFFTGSQSVGKLVMEKASKHLTPVTLELGGKSPCIVCESADLKLAARRIVFGKLLNCGQTCVAPDYILCSSKVKDRLIKYIKHEISHQYGIHALSNPNYGKIINYKHFKRIINLIEDDKVVFGGNYNEDTLKIEPTILDNITFDDTVMKEEIFGPVIPIITFENINSVIRKINSLPHPLALYVFSKDKTEAHNVLAKCGFGGGSINDTIIHLATNEMGFGGFGESGMGSYHGKNGFDTFTHYKNIVDKKTWLDLPMRYQKYNVIKEKMVRLFLK